MDPSNYNFGCTEQYTEQLEKWKTEPPQAAPRWQRVNEFSSIYCDDVQISQFHNSSVNSMAQLLSQLLGG
jgi:hypothetical protein